LFRPGFLFKISGDEVGFPSPVYERGESIASEDSGAADAAKTIGRAVDQRDKAVAGEDVVSGEFKCGEQLDPRRGEAFENFGHYIL